MSNQNTVNGFQNVPAQVITVNTEIAFLVPAASVYPGLPSPTLPVGSGISIAPPPDITGAGSAFDIHSFKIRLTGNVANPGGGNLTVKLYQVASTAVGVIAAAGGVTSAGAVGTGSTIFSTLTAYTTPANPSHFTQEWVVLWSSAVNRLDGYTTGITAANALYPFATVTAPVTSGVATVNQLNFMPSFTFATANAANSVQISEFVIERV